MRKSLSPCRSRSSRAQCVLFSCGLHPMQVIGNTGSNSTGEALHATEQGFAVGMHAALQINPYYGKTSKAGLKAHFDAGVCVCV